MQTERNFRKGERCRIFEAAVEVGRRKPSGANKPDQEDGPKFHAAISGNSWRRASADSDQKSIR